MAAIAPNAKHSHASADITGRERHHEICFVPLNAATPPGDRVKHVVETCALHSQ
jgi:hypothetical protein